TLHWVSTGPRKSSTRPPDAPTSTRPRSTAKPATTRTSWKCSADAGVRPFSTRSNPVRRSADGRTGSRSFLGATERDPDVEIGSQLKLFLGLEIVLLGERSADLQIARQGVDLLVDRTESQTQLAVEEGQAQPRQQRHVVLIGGHADIPMERQ